MPRRNRKPSKSPQRARRDLIESKRPSNLKRIQRVAAATRRDDA